MTENKTLSFNIDGIVRDLPPRQERLDVAAKHQDYIDLCVRDFWRMISNQRPLSRDFVDLTISLARNLKGGFAGIAKWIDSLIPDIDLASKPEYAFATRAIGSTGVDSTPRKMTFEKLGDGCSLGIEIEMKDSVANVKLWLLDDAGNTILPFSLSVRDVDSGKMLLERREFKVGSAKFNGVARGRYELIAFAGRLNCNFVLAVE